MKSSINLALDPGFGIKLKWNDEQRKTKAEDRAFCPWQLSTSLLLLLTSRSHSVRSLDMKEKQVKEFQGEMNNSILSGNDTTSKDEEREHTSS